MLGYVVERRLDWVETYIVQNFMRIQNLASILTSEAAFQSTASVIFWGFLSVEPWLQNKPFGFWGFEPKKLWDFLTARDDSQADQALYKLSVFL